jgi:hypothetical protein
MAKITYDDYLLDQKFRDYSVKAKNIDELRNYLKTNNLYNKDDYFTCVSDRMFSQ